MSQGIQVEVWGDYALFTRPELKVERVSYDVMTPSAARGIIEAIYWHPGLRWHIDRIHVMNPIAFTNIRRNEVKDKISAANVRSVMNGSARPLAIYTEGKFIDISRRRLERGQCYHQPCFGCREFPASFRAWRGGLVPAIPETRSLGIMLYDMDYSDPRDIQPMFFMAELTNGVLEVAGKEVLR